MKKLKLQLSYHMQWGNYKDTTLYVTATSRKNVVELLAKIGVHVTVNEVKNFFMGWGTNHNMGGIEITEPCVYGVKGAKWIDKDQKETPVKLV